MGGIGCECLNDVIVLDDQSGGRINVGQPLPSWCDAIS
jgi:hypothetical protein